MCNTVTFSVRESVHDLQMAPTSACPRRSGEAQVEEAQVTWLLPPFWPNCPWARCSSLEFCSCKSESLWPFECLKEWRKCVCNCENVDVFYYLKCQSVWNVLPLCCVALSYSWKCCLPLSHYRTAHLPVVMDTATVDTASTFSVSWR